MIVCLRHDGTLELLDADNFRAFSFKGLFHQIPHAEAVEFGDGYAWISQAALRSLQPYSQQTAWLQNLDSMIEFATTQGWVSAETGRIRAHIE